MIPFKISMMTATHNRPELLARLHSKLQAQSTNEVYEVQWLIGMDDAGEETERIVQNFKNNPSWLAIASYTYSGIGKTAVLNRLQEYQTGQVTIIVDDDDYLVDDAFDTIVRDWGAHENVDQIAYLQGNQLTLRKVKSYPMNLFVGNVFDYRFKADLRGDYFETYRTNYFNQFKFPEFEGERFVGEGTKWQPMALAADGVFVNKVMYLSKYLPEGLTSNARALQIKNPQGVMFRQKQIIQEPRFTIKKRLRAMVMYAIFSNFTTISDERTRLNNRFTRIVAEIGAVILRPYANLLQRNVEKS
jgi:glycosyltransferase involved in cell wall biosynthesis